MHHFVCNTETGIDPSHELFEHVVNDRIVIALAGEGGHFAKDHQHKAVFRCKLIQINNRSAHIGRETIHRHTIKLTIRIALVQQLLCRGRVVCQADDFHIRHQIRPDFLNFSQAGLEIRSTTAARHTVEQLYALVQPRRIIHQLFTLGRCQRFIRIKILLQLL